MSKVIMISRDVKIFDINGAVYARALEYANLFDELHIIVLAKTKKTINKPVSSKNLFFYDTTSRFKIGSFLKTLRVATRLARKMKNGEDWITSQDPFEGGFIAFIASILSGLRLQLQLHTDCFSQNFVRHSVGNRFRNFMSKILLPKADSIRVVSERIKESLLSTFHFPLSTIKVLPIFVDIEAIKNKIPTFSFKTKYPEFDKIVLVLARLEKEKNITLALLTFQKMLRLNNRLGLVVAGAGREEKWLKAYVKHLGIETSVRFEGWVTDVVSAYKTADLLLVTSFYEGYGMNIIEALSCGCAVVSTDVGIASEAGAEIVPYDAGEIALKSLDLLVKNTKGILNQKFIISKDDYLMFYKQTFS